MANIKFKKAGVNDLDFLYYIYNDPEILENSLNDGSEPIKKKEILKTINYFEDNNLDLLIAYDDVYKIGMVNMYEKNFNENYTMVGLALAKDARNMGLGVDVMVAFEAYILDTYGINQICGQAYSNNPRSLAFIEKLGYKKDPKRSDQIDINGKIVDRYFFSKIIHK